MTIQAKRPLLLALFTGLMLFTGLPADGIIGHGHALAASQKTQPDPAQHHPPQEQDTRQSSSEVRARRTPVVRVVEEAGPAVVSIFSTRSQEPSPFSAVSSSQNQAIELGSQSPQQSTMQSLGSGIIIDGARALVLTNAHVILGATQVTVRLLGGREYRAKMVGADADTDLAVLRLELPSPPPVLPQVRLGNSSGLMIGESVIAIGNPYGLAHTVTTGVVSALDRSVSTGQTTATGLIQTDAAINPGSSGGPLLNALGKVVGINAAIFNRGQGLNFAIPINRATSILRELIAKGRLSHVWIGLAGEDMDQAQAVHFGLDRVRGMVVTEVLPGTPAAAAGIRTGDAVLTIDGNDVEEKAQCQLLMHAASKGGPIKMMLRRGRALIQVQVLPQILDKKSGRGLILQRWGFAPADDASRGAQVGEVRAGGPAADLGFKPGDVVHQVGARSITNESDLLSAFCRYQMHTTLIVTVQRGEQFTNVRLKI
ncbi:MAG: peptidase [Deltaproteobacteria bacterium HGW-Deltaproteobacteria-8]|jgi:S1-C subfamily serine protease|nr:MAG: peptidase [Deltaproteobacteria bacterium HGW-Deltaproteobacteria-8]